MGARRARPVRDRFDIKAMVHRKGKSLRDLALESGLSESACRVALIRPLPAGEAAIADFLGLTLQDLWPDRYPSLPTSRSEHATTSMRETSLMTTTIQTPTTATRARSNP